MTPEDITKLAQTLGGLSESECDYMNARQSKVGFIYATDLNGLCQTIEGMTSAEIDDLLGQVEPLGPGNGKRKVIKR